MLDFLRFLPIAAKKLFLKGETLSLCLRRGRNCKLFQNGFSVYSKQAVPLIKAHGSLSKRPTIVKTSRSNCFGTGYSRILTVRFSFESG